LFRRVLKATADERPKPSSHRVEALGRMRGDSRELGQVLREATRPIESADLREVSDLRKRGAIEPRLWGEKRMLRPILMLP
jgi:hypothetical protein